jgi:glyoxylase-like metal-dependent hydrolase (beta-lactamase superfamily II)
MSGAHRGASVLLCSMAFVLGASAARAAKPKFTAAATPPASAAVTAPVAVSSVPPDGELHALHVQGNVWMIVGAGGNVAVQVGEQGVLVVDTGFTRNAAKLLALIREIAGERKVIRYVINTQMHPDHTGGNEAIRQAGETIMGGNVGRDDIRGQQGATVFANENALLQMIGPDAQGKSVAQPLWPTETIAADTYDIFFNGEAVRMVHPHHSHTDGDLIVYFAKSDVIVAGDNYVNVIYPIIDLGRGGSVNGLLDALNDIIDIAVPADKQENGTFIIPGHGRLADEADVVETRDMVTIIRDRIQDLVLHGATLEQIRAARPTSDYDGRYGVDAGFWTTDKFVEAIYRSLAPEKNGGK